MIILYQYPALWNLPNLSPFCLKVETYLRMAAIPYEVKFTKDPRKAPKGKLPYIRKDKKVLGDSDLIIDYLKIKFGDSLDANLTDLQKAESVLLESCFSERLYWFMLYLRWQDEDGWIQINQAFFSHMPGYLRWFLPALLRHRMKKSLYLQGTGRHSKNEIVDMAEKTIGAISTYLGLNNYFMGEDPSSIDATAFGFLANIAWLPFDDPLKTILMKHNNLKEFCTRMWESYFSDREPSFSLINQD